MRSNGDEDADHTKYAWGGTSNFSDSQASRHGKEITDWPGWINNAARESIYNDVNPLPITPVRFTDWTGRQIQLHTGWDSLNFGKRDASPWAMFNVQFVSSNAGTPSAFPVALPGNQQAPTGKRPPSNKQQQNMIRARIPSDALGPGTGRLAPGVSLARRTYYG